MSKEQQPGDARAWSKKVNPSRARKEERNAQYQANVEAAFEELFGPRDAELEAQMSASIDTLAAIGNARLQEAQEHAASADNTMQGGE